MLERGGAAVRLAGFVRGTATLADAVAKREPLVLGVSHDAAMLHRVATTARAAARPGALKRHMADSDVIMARNLEQLAVARRVTSGRRLVYECLDIHRLLTSEGRAGRALQAVERRLLAGIDLLLTSSPGFVREHFAPRLGDTPVRLVENKMLVERLPETRGAPLAPQVPLQIGWFGMLRCKRSVAVLRDVARDAGGRIDVTIRGKPSPAELPDLARDIAGTPHIAFAGPYAYHDLPALYAQCHLAWAVDWFEEGQNSAWLLPNRLYESLAFGVVPIVLDGTELANWARTHGVGLVVKDAKHAREKLLALTPDTVAVLQREVAAVPLSAVMADDTTCRELVQVIAP